MVASNRPAARKTFANELSRFLVLLAEMPETGRSYPHAQIPGLRRVLMPETKYHVYYVFDPIRTEVVVLAVWGSARERGPVLRPPRRIN